MQKPLTRRTAADRIGTAADEDREQTIRCASLDRFLIENKQNEGIGEDASTKLE